MGKKKINKTRWGMHRMSPIVILSWFACDPALEQPWSGALLSL
jgi:hypothetical protein